MRKTAAPPVVLHCPGCGLYLVITPEDVRAAVRVPPRCERCAGRTERVKP